LAKIPTGDRLDCLAQLPHSVAPHTTYLTDIAEGLRAIARKKDESLVNLHRSQQTGRWSTCTGNQMFSEGNRIIVIKTFFATPFSDLFRLEINY